MDQILDKLDLGANALLIIGIILVDQRLRRVEKSVDRIADRADEYETKVDRMEGRFDNWRKVN